MRRRRSDTMTFRKLCALLLAVAVLAKAQLVTDEQFTCPEDASIRPCRCSTLPPNPTVFCGDVRSLKTVHRALGHRFSASHPIPSLKLLRCRFVGLPGSAFANISVTRLHIRDSVLRYVDPSAFEGMPSLLILVLENVRLSSLPPESLHHLPSLARLSLVDNKLVSMPRDALNGAKSLHYLDLARNHISHLERGAFPIGLVTLSLASNFIVSLNRSVRYLVNLEWLVLTNNRLVSIEGELEQLFNLRHLNLGNNLLRSLGESLRNLRHLKYLELQYNSISQLENSLRNLSHLKGLNLSMNIYLQLDCDVFVGLSSLEMLDLSGNRLTDLKGSLRPLTSLITLDLSRNSLSSFAFREIRTLAHLHLLDLNDNGLLFLEPEAIIGSVPTASLLFSRNNLTSMSGFLRHFPQLQEIDISNNRISRVMISDFSVSSDLFYVNIEGNPLQCDAEQMDAYHQLRNKKIEMDGEPRCSQDPMHL